MSHDTEVDRMLADPRLAAVMEDWTARMVAGRPYRWHRLVHDTLGVLDQGPDLAMVTDMKWRLARAGLETTLISEWRPCSPAPVQEETP